MRIPDKVLKTINTAYTHIAQTRMGTDFVTGRGMAMELDLRRTLVLYFVGGLKNDYLPISRNVST
jgi:hypothetical protein